MLRNDGGRGTRLSICAVTDDRRAIAWLALEKGTPVIDATGAEIGKVSQVIADEQKDIFSGIQWRQGILGDEHYVPADLIDELTAGAVRLRVAGADAQQEPPG
jgi:uncharacterized protein YrrD